MKYVLTYMLFCFSTLQAQNLVIDNGFECKSNHRSKWHYKYSFDINTTWMSFYETVDFNVGKNNNPIKLQNNEYGNGIMPYEGIGFASFFMGKIPECVLGQLKEELIKGKKYNINIYTRKVLKINEDNYLLKNLGVAFSKKMPTLLTSTDDFTRYGICTLSKSDLSAIDEKSWQKISGTYTARGGEKYLLIGYFKTMPQYDTVTKGFTPYYAVDNIEVSLSEIAENANHLKDLKILFDTNSAVIKEAYKDELEKVSLYLMENKNIFLNITGHTDNEGTNGWNLNLSKRRANAVKKYLMKFGLEENRVTVLAKGSNNPISANNSQSKFLNRRVEITFLNNNK